MTCTRVTVDNHATVLLSVMNDLYQSNLLTDVVLVAEGREFRVHMVVLAAYSPHFKQLWTSGCDTTAGFQHHIHNVHAECLHLVVDFLYTGCVQLNPIVVLSLLAASQQLGIQSLHRVCQDYLQNHAPCAGNTQCATSSVANTGAIGETDPMIAPKSGVKEEPLHDGSQPNPLSLNAGSQSDSDSADLDPTWQPKACQSSAPKPSSHRHYKPRQTEAKAKVTQDRAHLCSKKFLRTYCRRSHQPLGFTNGKILQKRSVFLWHLRKDVRLEGNYFECRVCEQSFCLYSSYRKHYVNSHGHRYCCTTCTMTFPWLHRLLLHRRMHPQKVKGHRRMHPQGVKGHRRMHPQKVKGHRRMHPQEVKGHRRMHPQDNRTPEDFIICQQCGQPFLYSMNYRKHCRRLHSKTGRRQVKEADSKQRKCDECDWNANNTRELIKHMAAHHPNVLYQCNKCTSKYKYSTPIRECMERHMEKRHSVNEKSMVCEICDKVFVRPGERKLHQYVKHGILHPDLKFFRCGLEGCDFVTCHNSVIVAHRTTHVRQDVTCEHCGVTLKNDKSLKRHIERMHINGHCFICEECGATYGSKAELKHHLKLHKFGKDLLCEQCDYRTHNGRQLNRHRYLVHHVPMEKSQLKTYECELCPFRTCTANSYRIHMRVHYNIKDVACKSCDKKFTSLALMKQHWLAAHGEKNLKCGFCGFSTALKNKLQEHERVMHTARGHKPYKCAYCDFHCATSGNCRKHVMQRHKGMEVKVVKVAEVNPKPHQPQPVTSQSLQKDSMVKC